MGKEKKKLKAKIIGLWGDPGLSEYHNYDILSRFLIVQIEPFQECVTNKRKAQMIKLVLRPKSLWINVQSGTSQPGIIRRDSFGNLNQQNITGVGSATPNLFTTSNNGLNGARFLAQNIQPISPSYKIGDEITIVEINEITSSVSGRGSFRDGVDIFKTDDTRTNTDSFMSNAYRDLEAAIYGGGNINRYFRASKNNIAVRTNYELKYFPAYHKILQTLSTKYAIGQTNLPTAESITNNDEKIKAKGGIFNKRMDFPAVMYEDLNIENRKRLEPSACVPVVVVNPSTFPTPAQRNSGGINITL